jgi:hypothetical protein
LDFLNPVPPRCWQHPRRRGPDIPGNCSISGRSRYPVALGQSPVDVPLQLLWAYSLTHKVYECECVTVFSRARNGGTCWWWFRGS